MEYTPSSENFMYSGTEALENVEKFLFNYNRGIVRMFLENAGELLKSEAQILDFGAGVGTLSEVFQKETGLWPKCLEIDERQRAVIRRRGFLAYASLHQLPHSYDLIFSSNVFEHIEEDEEVLRNVGKFLKVGGRLLIYVPAFKILWTPMDDQVGHFRRYRRRDLKRKLQATGFKVLKAHYCDSLGYFLTLLAKILQLKQENISSGTLTFYDNYLWPISQIGDKFFSPFFGKNLFVVAEK